MKHLQMQKLRGSIWLMTRFGKMLRGWLLIGAVERRIDALVELNRALVARVAALEGYNSNASNRIASLIRQFDVATDDVVKLSREIEELRQRVSVNIHSRESPVRTARNWSEFENAAVAAQQEKS